MINFTPFTRKFTIFALLLLQSHTNEIVTKSLITRKIMKYNFFDAISDKVNLKRDRFVEFQSFQFTVIFFIKSAFFFIFDMKNNFFEIFCLMTTSRRPFPNDWPEQTFQGASKLVGVNFTNTEQFLRQNFMHMVFLFAQVCREYNSLNNGYFSVS